MNAAYRTIHSIQSAARVYRGLIDRFVVPIFLRKCGVILGENCVFAGFPHIMRSPSCTIRIGNSVTVNSRPASNALGLVHPTFLSAIGAESTIEIGNGTGISGASIVATRCISIGQNVLIGAGAALWDSDFHALTPDLRSVKGPEEVASARIIIEDAVFLGARSIVLKGVRIGRGAVVGAGCVVGKDIAPYSVAVGNPARIIRVLSGAHGGDRERTLHRV